MILWCDGAHDAPENMRRDAALLARVERGGPPVLRLFRFEPPGITLGRAQDPARELDLERCRAAGVLWAVRPTGGRAIYHDEEWTYSCAAPLGDSAWGGTLEQAYLAMSRVIVASLERLGVPAALAAGAARGSLEPRERRGPAAPCFASTARHEVVVRGRKVVGSAQRRTARALLQQGSVLLGPAHLRLVEFQALPDAERARVRAALQQTSADLRDIQGEGPPLDRWADALASVLPPTTGRLDGEEGRRRLLEG